MPKLLWDNAKNDTLNDWLKALLKKANIETYGKNVKFQGCANSYMMYYAEWMKLSLQLSRLKRQMQAKSLIRTSLDAECERIFKESYKLFALNGDVSGKAKTQLAEKIEQLEKENAELKTVLKAWLRFSVRKY